jgi:hypothetical protein
VFGLAAGLFGGLAVKKSSLVKVQSLLVVKGVTIRAVLYLFLGTGQLCLDLRWGLGDWQLATAAWSRCGGCLFLMV